MEFTCRVCGHKNFTFIKGTPFHMCSNCTAAFVHPGKFNLPTVKFKKLHPDATTPKKAKEGDVAYDLFALHDEDIHPGTAQVVKTGIAIELPPYHEAQVRTRSSMPLKKDLVIANAPGTIDTGYRGDVGLILHNFGDEVQKVKKGDRLGQLLIMPKLHYKLEEVNELSSTERGIGGFGSTGE